MLIDFSYKRKDGKQVEVTAKVVRDKILYLYTWDDSEAEMISRMSFSVEEMSELIDWVYHHVAMREEDLWSKLTDCGPNESRITVSELNSIRGVK